MSTKVNESNSSGREEPIVTGSSGQGTRAEKADMEAPSKKQPKPSQNVLPSSLKTPADYLPIFQEDLRILRQLGVRWQIFPNLPGWGLGIVFENLYYEDGDLKYKE